MVGQPWLELAHVALELALFVVGAVVIPLLRDLARRLRAVEQELAFIRGRHLSERRRGDVDDKGLLRRFRAGPGQER